MDTLTDTFTQTQQILLGILIAWSYVWKGFGLWAAGSRKRKDWFVLLFLVNTIGILEIAYIFIFADRNKKSE